MRKTIYPLILATLLVGALRVDSQAQATGSATNSGGTTGIFGNTTSQTGAGQMGMGGLTTNLTSQQSISSMQTAGQGLLAPGSVNTSPYPSEQWSYGFPTEGSQLYGGLSGSGLTGILTGSNMLPATSTSSVNLNTVDCPFIRMPNEGDGVGANSGGLNINLGPVDINLNTNGLTNGLSNGISNGINSLTNGTVQLNTQQSLNSLNNFFGP